MGHGETETRLSVHRLDAGFYELRCGGRVFTAHSAERWSEGQRRGYWLLFEQADARYEQAWCNNFATLGDCKDAVETIVREEV